MRSDPNAVDLLHQRLRLADDVVVWPVRERGDTVYRLEIPSEHKFFRVGYQEYLFISLLDGNTTIPQACGLAAAKLGKEAPTARQAESIQRWLLQNKLAYLPSEGTPVRGRAQRSDKTAAQWMMSKVNPFWMKLPVLKSKDGSTQRQLAAIAKPFLWLFAPPCVFIGCALIIAGLITLWLNWGRFCDSTAQVFTPSSWVWLFVFWVGLKIVHELAHAVACCRRGGEVSELGVVFILFAPMAYVDVTSCWRMPSRWSRIAVSSAGMYVELVIASVALMAWANTDSQSAQSLLHSLVFTAGVSTILFNANALMRFDGYFILADLIDIPNLHGESTKEIQRLAKRFLIGQRDQHSVFVGWRLWFVRCYGVAAIVWKVVICFTLGIAAATMFSGAGIVLAVLGSAMWFGQPATKLYKFSKQLLANDKPQFVRGCFLAGLCIVVLAGSTVWLPIPTAVKAPAIVTFVPDTLVRSGANGFVSQVHVTNAANVQPGDRLLELENPELRAKLGKLKIELAQIELREREAIDENDPSGQLVFREQQRTLRQQIAQVQQQVDSLTFVATRSGSVIGRRLNHRLGTYVREGDALMTIAGPAEKELVAAVHQERIEEARACVGKTISVRTAGFRKFSGRLERVDPRATNRLPSPALSALEGGSLSVRESSSEESAQDDSAVRLLEPHFAARITLDNETAAQMEAGLRVDTFLGYRRDPIATRVAQAVRRLWHQAKDESTASY